MRVKTTITLEYKLEDKEVVKFRTKVLERVQEEVERVLTIDDIPVDIVEEFLADAISNAIESSYEGYSRNSGVEIDTYFETISFDYCGEDVSNWVQEVADQILADMEEE